MRMHGIAAMAALAGSLALAGCQTTALPPSADNPGTSVRITNADPTKWDGRRISAARASIFACRPLACADRALVLVQTLRAPTRDPDPKALEKAAKMLPAQTRAQNAILEVASDGNESVEALSSKVTKLKGFPAVLAESKRHGRGKPIYTTTGHVFAGYTHVKIVSESIDREQAKRHFEDFLAAIAIEDFAPQPPPGPAVPPAAALGPEPARPS